MTSVSNGGKRRLLVLTSTFPRWDNDTEPAFVFELARRLTDAFEIRVLAPHAKGAARYEEIAGLTIQRYRYGPDAFETLTHGGGITANLRRYPWRWLLVPGLFVAQFLAIRKSLREWRPDVIHAHWIIPQGLLAVLASGRGSRVRLVTTSHGADLFSLNGSVFKRIKKFVLRRSDCVTVVSRAMSKVVHDLGTETDKIRVAPMGVDLQERFTPATGLKRSDSEVLFVGRLVEKKGLPFLLDALSAISKTQCVTLTVVGFGPEEGALREQVKRLGLDDRVTFLGPVAQSDLPPLYRRASVFVAPFVQATSGDQEGLGLVVVEAIGCGCPVVVSDLPAVRDVLEEDALEYRVRPGNSSDLASAIMRVLADPAGACERTLLLRRRIASRFDWSEVAKRYSECLASGLSES